MHAQKQYGDQFFQEVGLLLGYNAGENIKDSLQFKKKFVLSN